MAEGFTLQPQEHFIGIVCENARETIKYLVPYDSVLQQTAHCFPNSYVALPPPPPPSRPTNQTESAFGAHAFEAPLVKCVALRAQFCPDNEPVNVQNSTLKGVKKEVCGSVVPR